MLSAATQPAPAKATPRPSRLERELADLVKRSRTDRAAASHLVDLIRRLFPPGLAIYPRRAYHLRELPLMAINQVLKNHGWWLEPHSVRDSRLFVYATDWPDWGGGTERRAFGLFEVRQL